jgi:hypothetical protein
MPDPHDGRRHIVERPDVDDQEDERKQEVQQVQGWTDPTILATEVRVDSTTEDKSNVMY